MSVVWTLSLSATGMPCSGPRSLPAARSWSHSSASSRAFGLTVMTGWSRYSYVAMRMSDCCTRSCELTRPSRSAGGDSRGTDTPRYHQDVDSEVVEVLKEIRDEVRGTN